VSDCPNLVKCPFFNDQLANMPTIANLMKENYCRETYDVCARYLVAKTLGSASVPKDLFPAQKERALKIIADASAATH
jgi:hypothetical protein